MSQQQQQKIHVKLQFNNEFRRFIIEPQTQFNDLEKQISTLLHVTTPISIRYLDEESEWITIDTDKELLTGIELSPALLRLQVTPTSTIPIQESPNPQVEGCKYRRRRCNKNRENFDTVSDEKSCKKFKRHCRKVREENNSDTVSDEKSCKRWRKFDDKCTEQEGKPWKRHCKKFREENCKKVENDDTASEEKGCKKYKRHCRRFKEENCNDTVSEEKRFKRHCRFREENGDDVSEEKGCKRWRKLRQQKEEGSDEGKKECTERRRQCRGSWGGQRGRHAWKHFGMEQSDSESLEETRPVEEIKKEINSLKEEIGALVANKKGLWEELVAFKTQIRTLRQSEGTRDEILNIREQLCEKRRAVRVLHVQITNSKRRIWKLKSALVMKSDI